jgi:DNA-directed RNA polymerase subunit RPC12/RpoP
MLANCDKCGKDFEFEIKQKKITEEITQHYSECPECETVYNSYFSNKEVERLMERNRQLMKKVNDDNYDVDNIPEMLKMLREFQENKNKIIAEQSRIKKIIGFNDE